MGSMKSCEVSCHRDPILGTKPARVEASTVQPYTGLASAFEQTCTMLRGTLKVGVLESQIFTHVPYLQLSSRNKRLKSQMVNQLNMAIKNTGDCVSLFIFLRQQQNTKHFRVSEKWRKSRPGCTSRPVWTLTVAFTKGCDLKIAKTNTAFTIRNAHLRCVTTWTTSSRSWIIHMANMPRNKRSAFLHTSISFTDGNRRCNQSHQLVVIVSNSTSTVQFFEVILSHRWAGRQLPSRVGELRSWSGHERHQNPTLEASIDSFESRTDSANLLW